MQKGLKCKINFNPRNAWSAPQNAWIMLRYHKSITWTHNNIARIKNNVQIRIKTEKIQDYFENPNAKD